MRSNHRSNALLIELLIVVLFFMLAATVLLQVFSAARAQSAKAEKLAEATSWAQNVADRLYAAGSADEALSPLGFSAGDDSTWFYEAEGFSATLALSDEPGAEGLLRRVLTVTDREETLITLTCAKYEEVRP